MIYLLAFTLLAQASPSPGPAATPIPTASPEVIATPQSTRGLVIPPAPAIVPGFRARQTSLPSADIVGDNAPSGQAVSLSDTKITIDAGGIHGTTKAATQIITLKATADLVGGPIGDKFALRVTRLAADPLPPGLVDLLRGLVDSSTSDISGTIPFLVRQVAFRNGCFWVSGVTPN